MRSTIHVAAGVIADASGRLLLSRRAPGKHAAGFWEFPGGKLQAQESPEAALSRELAEELGITVQAAEPLIEYQHEYPGRQVWLYVFRVTRFAGDPAGLEGQPLKWVSPDQALEAGLLPADRPILDALRLSRPADRS